MNFPTSATVNHEVKMDPLPLAFSFFLAEKLGFQNLEFHADPRASSEIDGIRRNDLWSGDVRCCQWRLFAITDEENVVVATIVARPVWWEVAFEQGCSGMYVVDEGGMDETKVEELLSLTTPGADSTDYVVTCGTKLSITANSSDDSITKSSISPKQHSSISHLLAPPFHGQRSPFVRAEMRSLNGTGPPSLVPNRPVLTIDTAGIDAARRKAESIGESNALRAVNAGIQSVSPTTSTQHTLTHGGPQMALVKSSSSVHATPKINKGPESVHEAALEAFEACLVQADHLHGIAFDNLGSCQKQNSPWVPFAKRALHITGECYLGLEELLEEMVESCGSTEKGSGPEDIFPGQDSDNRQRLQLTSGGEASPNHGDGKLVLRRPPLVNGFLDEFESHETDGAYQISKSFTQQIDEEIAAIARLNQTNQFADREISWLTDLKRENEKEKVERFAKILYLREKRHWLEAQMQGINAGAETAGRWITARSYISSTGWTCIILVMLLVLLQVWHHFLSTSEFLDVVLVALGIWFAITTGF